MSATRWIDRLNSRRRASLSGRGVGLRAVGFGITAVLAAALVLVTIKAPAHGPDHPYDHENFSEVSAATETVVDGPVRTVIEELEAYRYWCVQPRRNHFAVQFTCRGEARVDLIATTKGAISYASIDDLTGLQESRTQLWKVLNASFLRLWPSDRTAIQNLLEDAQPFTFLGDPIPSEPHDPYPTHAIRTDNASWSLTSSQGDPIILRLRTAHLRDHSWPFGSGHYAESLSAAITALEADGFTCETACYRATDEQAVSFHAHDGQIVTARFTLRTKADGDRAEDASGRWIRAGLPFLKPAVRAAVGQRIELSRFAHSSWHGVVAGTPVDMTAVTRSTVTTDGHTGYDLRVVIGIPLLRVE